MTRSQNTKRALVFSVISLMLCLSLLLGTTFAWFTDSVSNKGNTIQAGTLSISMDNTTTPLFSSANSKWEPGYSEKKQVTLQNDGNLWLKYALRFTNVQTSDTVDPAADITEVLDVYKVDKEADSVAATDLNEDNYLGTVKDLMNVASDAQNGILAPQGYTGDDGTNSTSFTLVIKMQESAGNDYQGATADFTVEALATQYTYETDGFGSNQYDADATYDQVNVTVTDNATANGAALEKAIGEVANGGTVFVPAGNYEMDSINLSDKEVTIVGEPGAVMVATNNNGDVGGITVQGAEGAKLTVRDMVFKAPEGADTSTAWRGICFSGQGNSDVSLVVENCTFDNLVSGIYMGGVSDATITGCTFTNCNAGIGGSEDVTGTLTVDGCTFTGVTETIGWAGSGSLVIKNCPTCQSFNDYNNGGTAVTVKNGNYPA